ncbi:hypothetical protein BSL78_19444 [Apostichopus japonicus]|uniref:Uncharacterized protein n=1 Tax=Stichopus japonicus TaxID=307972 RepID=A0A2G8K6S7_STIJA|nr:hypothetical protein BSL78_19444 [Apostichopus japonicus]
MEPDSVNLDEVIDEPNPCLIVMNSQVEDPDNEDTRVRRLQQLAALKDSSSSNDQEKEQGKEEHREKEDDDDSSDEDEVLFVPPSQADEMLEEKAPSRANETLLQSFISTPSETVGILHLSGESSRILVPETSDDTLSTQQTSDEAHPIISNSPSDNTLADSSKEETKKEEDEEFQVPEWQKAINASEVEQRVSSSSKEVSSASNSSATSESVNSQSSNSAPSLQLLQNWQDPNQVDSSQSLIQQRDFAAQASASASPQLIIDSQQLTDSVQIIAEVESGKSSHSTAESGVTSGASRHVAQDIHGMENVTSSQDFRLHLTQSQTETEAEGVGVYMDAALKKESSAGTHRYTLDQVSQTRSYSDDERPIVTPKSTLIHEIFLRLV